VQQSRAQVISIIDVYFY